MRRDLVGRDKRRQKRLGSGARPGGVIDPVDCNDERSALACPKSIRQPEDMSAKVID